MAEIDRLFKKMRQADGSDLHLAAGRPPATRANGEIVALADEPALGDGALRTLMRPCVSASHWQAYAETLDIDFAYALDGVGRFRGNYFVQEHGAAAVFRHVPDTVIPLEKLDPPAAVVQLADVESGLVLVTGPTGSGKSTTLAAIIDRINTKYCRHIVTIEDPVEFVHRNKRSVLSQREVGTNTVSFAAALRSAMRQDADVILVGEMRDLETVALALDAAAMGKLVFGTLHTSGAAKTIDRVIDVFPTDRQPQARDGLAESLTAVVSQVLLRRKGGGRVAAHEILLRTSALPGVIRDANISMLNQVIAGGQRQGMQTMDGALAALHGQGVIEAAEAYLYAENKERFA